MADENFVPSLVVYCHEDPDQVRVRVEHDPDVREAQKVAQEKTDRELEIQKAKEAAKEEAVKVLDKLKSGEQLSKDELVTLFSYLMEK